MKNYKSLTILAKCLILTTVMSGCASKHTAPQSDEFGVFYDGDSQATYATAFPISSPQEAYRNGDAALRSGDSDRALFEFIRGLRMDAEPNLDVLYKVASIHHRHKNFRLADLAYRWVLEREPLNVNAGTGLGLALLEQRQYEAAREHLEIVRSSGRAPWRAYNALGILADMDEDFEKAADFYQQALQMEPRSPIVLNNLGYSRYLAGDWEGANLALQRALRLHKDYERAWRNLALVYARQKNYQRALEALGRTGDEAQAYNDIGFVAMLEGDHAQALVFFETAMHLSPSFYVIASENADNAKRMLSRSKSK